MGKKPAARQPSPMWVTTADLPTSAGHPFFERLNRVLEEAGFDAFVEGLCAVFYASRLGRPSLRPGRYFRLLFIGYFEGLSSERGIAWRVADSLSLRAFLDLDVTEAPPNHSTLSRTRRLIDVETHVAVFTWVLERLAGAGLVQGKTVGVDATTLEANAAMRSIERRDTGESYEAFVRQLARASGIETPTRAELARFDRSRKDRKTSNKEWQSPQDPDAKIAKMKDGRTHLAHKAEHGIDLETGAILSVTVQDASEGDSATLPETLTMAAEQVEAVQPAGAEVGRGGRRQGVPQRRDAGGSRRDWGSQLRSRSRSGVGAVGRTRRRERRRRRSVLRRRHYMGTVGVFAATEAVVFNAAAGSWWSGLSRTSTRPGGCGGCGCAATRMCASGCSSVWVSGSPDRAHRDLSASAPPWCIMANSIRVSDSALESPVIGGMAMKETSGSGAAVDQTDDSRGENQLRQERGFLRVVDTIISAVGVFVVTYGVWVAIDTLKSIEKSVTVAENQLNLSAEQFTASFNARWLDQRPWLPFSRAENRTHRTRARRRCHRQVPRPQ